MKPETVLSEKKYERLVKKKGLRQIHAPCFEAIRMYISFKI
jgi:hypothetical protein